MTRRIVYVSGTRADFGLMRHALQTLSADPRLEVSVLVTGMHLSEEFGATWREIEAAGLPIAARVPVNVTTRSRASMSASLGEAVIGMTDALQALRPDAVMVLGDRGEMLAAAIVCLHLGLPLFHVHGGERSGTVDEPMRHSISKMATWHLVTTQGSRERLVRMGEPEDSIFVTGAPGLDGLVESSAASANELLAGFGLDPGAPFALGLFHPVVQQAEAAAQQVRDLIEAVRHTGLQTLWLAPNSDAGSAALAEQARQALASGGRSAFVVHLSREQFATAMRHCAVMVGNSSAGIIEAASFGTPVVNVGDRQNLRERNRNAVDCGNAPDEIGEALRRALARGRYPVENVYGQGDAAGRLLKAVCEAPLDPRRLLKVNTY
ncbi:MAG: UDP-N-acetylglucosamine 2-epimerase (hydrolyzing) [Ramlibacter sp.]|nr:UDP-N-acetylglucosamine 2-epimerase (hydrolyzing) [Ramlibacter sp.]